MLEVTDLLLVTPITMVVMVEQTLAVAAAVTVTTVFLVKAAAELWLFVIRLG
jgi:hypothetical protein